MGTRKYLIQAIFGVLILLVAESCGAAIDEEEDSSLCCPLLRFFVRPRLAPVPIPRTPSVYTSNLRFELEEEDEQDPPSPDGYANVEPYSNVGGYSNVNDQLGDFPAVLGIPLELPFDSDGRHLSFRGSGGANYVPSDSDA